MDTTEFPKLIEQIYDAVEKLEKMTDNTDYVNGKRHFTPDGHMVGSMGEVLAMYHYGIVLDKASSEKHDGTVDGRNVQVKATQSDKKEATVGIRSAPDFLLVLKINKQGQAEEIYNGPGEFVKDIIAARKTKPSNGQYNVGLSRLKKLMVNVKEADKIKRINP